MNILPIKDFPNYYITDTGDVYSTYNKEKKLKKIKSKKTNKGYLLVNLYKNGKQYYKTIHRLVATAFIENPEDKTCVNHINGIRTDNNVSNLEWCSYSENNTHSYRVLGKKPTMANKGRFGKAHWNSKLILQIKEDKIIAEFWGAGEAARSIHKLPSVINAACKGKLKTAYGFVWKYKE